ncbi:hypothetical protein Hdeb2414_s0023g00626311 [Helianthus debilis subsp. tardiflorus]
MEFTFEQHKPLPPFSLVGDRSRRSGELLRLLVLRHTHLYRSYLSLTKPPSPPFTTQPNNTSKPFADTLAGVEAFAGVIETPSE